MWDSGAVRRYRGHAGLTAVAALAVAGVVVVGGDNTHPAGQVRLGSGAAWLASSTVGQATLLDGASAEVAAQVQVAPAGNLLEVVQHQATAYAIDQTAGTLRRVDGATFDMTPTRSPIPDAKAGLTAIPGRDTVYTVDTRRGILANTDPVTLDRRGELLSLAGQLSAGSATVDDNGTLWAMDNATGDLVRVAGGSRSVRRGVAQPGASVLAMAGARPVVVDKTSRRAHVIDPDTGRVRDTIDLDLRSDDRVEVSGSSRADRLYLVVSRGVLTVCELAGEGCGTVIPLSAGRFGAAVEAGGLVFVPNYTTGEVWVIDVGRSRVIAKAGVLSPDTRFQLIARDQVVFYNDPASENAGVVRLDGTVVPVTKYDRDNPTKGLTKSDSQSGDLPVDSGDPPNGPADPPVNPGDPGDPGDPTADPNGPPAEVNDPAADVNNPPGDVNVPPGNPDDRPEPALRIDMTNTSPTVDEVVTLEVESTSGDKPVAANWSFGDGTSGDGVITTHKWTQARDAYLVAVVATLPDGSQRTTSVNITVTETPRFTLAVDTPNGGTISGDGINCPQQCQVTVEPDTRITLTAQPDATHQVGTWGGACAGQSGNTCDITMDADKSAAHDFTEPTPKRTLRVLMDQGGRVTGNGVNCAAECVVEFDEGTQVRLNAVPNAGFRFTGWRFACSGGGTCPVTMNRDKIVKAGFEELEQAPPPPPPPPSPPEITNFLCEFGGNNRFICTVFHRGGVEFEWTVGNGRPFTTNDNTLSGGCVGRNTSIRVKVSNASGSATASDSVRCEGEPK